MRFVNETDYQADALWGSAGDADLGVAVISKATYELVGGGMARTGEDPWPVHPLLMETPYGTFPSEHTPYPKPRTDLIVLGFARPPGGEPVTRMEVKVSLGERFRYTLNVTGDRIWQRRDGQLAPTSPLPFTEMPLTLARAFGGTVETEWAPLPYAYNPEGRGFYTEEEQAAGAPLPNLEDPRAPVLTWRDRPAPAAPGIYPMGGALRGGQPGERPPGPNPPPGSGHLLHCWAHPDLMVEGVPAQGDLLRVEGIQEDGPLEVRVPGYEAVAVVEYGEDRVELPHKLDTIIVQGEERRVVFRWRSAGTFPLRPRERRLVRLVPNHPEERSATTCTA